MWTLFICIYKQHKYLQDKFIQVKSLVQGPHFESLLQLARINDLKCPSRGSSVLLHMLLLLPPILLAANLQWTLILPTRVKVLPSVNPSLTYSHRPIGHLQFQAELWHFPLKFSLHPVNNPFHSNCPCKTNLPDII